MAELDELLEYGAQVRPPGLEELERIATRRRRRAAAMAVSVAAVLVVTAIAAAGLLGAGDDQTAPVAPNPSVSHSAVPDPRIATPPPPDRITGPFPRLTPEQIRNHPDAQVYGGDDNVTGAPGVDARVWSVCLADCSRATSYQEGEYQEAVEVSRDNFETVAAYRLSPGSLGVSHVVDDWFALATARATTMVNSRGETRALARGHPVEVTEIAGPLVHANGVAYVDLTTLRLHAVSSPRGAMWDWWGAADSWYWGGISLVADSGRVTRHGAVWQNPDGSFGVTLLPIGASRGGTGLLKSGQPGTMAVVEHFAWPRVAHISTDYGATWQARLVPHDVASGGRLPASWTTWPTP